MGSSEMFGSAGGASPCSVAMGRRGGRAGNGGATRILVTLSSSVAGPA